MDAIERLRELAESRTHLPIRGPDARAILAHIDDLAAELAAAKTHVEALQAKDAGGCGCAHDSPGDVCQHHAQRELAAAKAERGQIVAWLRDTADPLESLDACSALERAADAIEAGAHQGEG